MTDTSITHNIRSVAPIESLAKRIVSSITETAKSGKIPWISVEYLPIGEVLSFLLAEEYGGSVLVWSVSSSVVNDIPVNFFNSSSELTALSAGIDYAEVLELLNKAGLERVKRVWGAGEYSVIGDVLTVWPVGNAIPYRIEIGDSVIERISMLDTHTWKQVGDAKQVVLLGNASDERAEGSIETKLLPGNPDHETLRIVFSDTSIIPESLKGKFKLIKSGLTSRMWNESQVRKNIEKGWTGVIAVSRNVEEAIKIADDIGGFKVFEQSLSSGFVSVQDKLMVFSNRELWETVRLTTKRSRGTFADLVLEDINPGDYVVHEDHGIAVYAGLQTIERDGVQQQYLELRYAKKDKLYVPVNQLQRVTKYVGTGGKLPTLTRLGGGEWKRITRKVSEGVKQLAGDLLRLYAVRELTHVSPVTESDTHIDEFENDFPFVETDDQLRAIEDVAEDLKRDRPMDRVLVGDVGFGKTEVAMRAAYMMVKAGKQVAVLAPTTVLVEQHFRVFSDRFTKWGVTVEALSRFLTDEQAKKIVSRVSEGKVDILIGTHRILSNDVLFKNLGLLIIDEEQKFGVAQKEKLKEKRVDMHVLSLSATPIPRTLNMALSGIRDISTLATPPDGRKPIENIVEKFSWDGVILAINNEISRGGQVYFVHNRVRTINTVKEKLSELMPHVRIGVGHGQMSPEALSKVMHGFLAGEYDVLLCTTIIENGLDMERVNTLIIERAEMFGLSQLYQMRGRIGRGSQQAYAYFFYQGGMGNQFVDDHADEYGEMKSKDFMKPRRFVDPELDAVLTDGILWDTARQRLDAIQELTALGSGFALAQRDLEIRGAGNFLGREQHGNVSAVGFSLYCKLLEQTVSRMRSTNTR